MTKQAKLLTFFLPNMYNTGAELQLKGGPVIEKNIRTKDGVSLFARTWHAPDSNHIATVALVHGLGEHCGRYGEVAKEMNNNGITVCSMDLRGHGNSPGERAFVEKFDRYLNDVDALLDSIEADPSNAGKSIFLMGHSMGGCISTLYAIERLPHRKSFPKVLILSSPALKMGEDINSCLICIGRILSCVLPHAPLKELDIANLSRDQKVVEDYRNDPLVFHGRIPARTGAEILKAMKRIEKGRNTLTLPVYIFYGTDDRLTEVRGNQEFFANISNVKDKTSKVYEGSYHETLNDLDRDRVIGDLISWMKDHVSQQDAQM